jgi:hypothetical protein
MMIDENQRDGSRIGDPWIDLGTAREHIHGMWRPSPSRRRSIVEDLSDMFDLHFCGSFKQPRKQV